METKQSIPPNPYYKYLIFYFVENIICGFGSFLLYLECVNDIKFQNDNEKFIFTICYWCVDFCYIFSGITIFIVGKSINPYIYHLRSLINGMRVYLYFAVGRIFFLLGEYTITDQYNIDIAPIYLISVNLIFELLFFFYVIFTMNMIIRMNEFKHITNNEINKNQ
jgi:hypothetical protein